MAEMAIPHIRVVKPEGWRGILVHPRGTRFFITLPGDEERELTAMRGAELSTNIDGPDEVTLRMLATMEVVYE